MSTHLLADVHLTGDDEPCAKHLRDYCRGAARDADAVYLLGDLFDLWLGDDACFEQHRHTIDALGELSKAGVAVYFMRGNRDFLVGQRFFATSGATLLDDPWFGPIEGVATLLTHGDSLCTNDPSQQRFRAQYNNPYWRAAILRLPLRVRRYIAKRIQNHSTHHKHRHNSRDLDVASEAISKSAADTGATRVIHGHTHRPSDDHVGGVDRHVLAAWSSAFGEYLSIDGDTVTRCPLT
ncbi:UDP-2,3-diacylglucosamine diphosphatase [Salinisphaera sp. USBA-960]|uniref:UDP-2,3-diacylglucosamine diphosphatase n=1 Tax=Salinisphaera orenii TaxID=856731 RepID=UPI000DBE527F|nr:UDP-2,3-diacylglucosamine diphosphatase [Salifodinibacter halophilus]NNC25862.1 UDP-2,3-diacylglucosamine diphosphatase [Salifodinibacter halophilus]